MANIDIYIFLHVRVRVRPERLYNTYIPVILEYTCTYTCIAIPVEKAFFYTIFHHYIAGLFLAFGAFIIATPVYRYSCYSIGTVLLFTCFKILPRVGIMQCCDGGLSCEVLIIRGSNNTLMPVHVYQYIHGHVPVAMGCRAVPPCRTGTAVCWQLLFQVL